jgi:DNA-binding NarL/FixJ family response regulator
MLDSSSGLQNNPGEMVSFSTLTPEKEQRIHELFKLTSEEMNPEKVQVLAAELGHSPMLHAPIPKRSQRQLQIIKLVAQGLKNREIAEKLGISSKVIKNYLGNIYRKIGVRNRVELALWYEALVHFVGEQFQIAP